MSHLMMSRLAGWIAHHRYYHHHCRLPSFYLFLFLINFFRYFLLDYFTLVLPPLRSWRQLAIFWWFIISSSWILLRYLVKFAHNIKFNLLEFFANVFTGCLDIYGRACLENFSWLITRILSSFCWILLLKTQSFVVD